MSSAFIFLMPFLFTWTQLVGVWLDDVATYIRHHTIRCSYKNCCFSWPTWSYQWKGKPELGRGAVWTRSRSLRGLSLWQDIWRCFVRWWENCGCVKRCLDRILFCLFLISWWLSYSPGSGMWLEFTKNHSAVFVLPSAGLSGSTACLDREGED